MQPVNYLRLISRRGWITTSSEEAMKGLLLRVTTPIHITTMSIPLTKNADTELENGRREDVGGRS